MRKIRWTILKSQLRIIKQDKLSVVGAGVFLFFLLVGILGPYVIPYDPVEMNVRKDGSYAILDPPSSEHWLGTNIMGQDIFSQVIIGTRVSIFTGVVAAFVVILIGANIALIAGYYGGTVDNILMRLVDFCYSLPFVPFAIILGSLFHPSIWNVIFAVALVMWRSPARVIRSQVLSIKERPFIKAARTLGASNVRIIYLHIAPNIMPLACLYIATTVGWAILAEANLSFLGVGDPSIISWGKILEMCFISAALERAWWWALPPGMAITFLVVSVFLISRAYEEAANPRLRRR